MVPAVSRVVVLGCGYAGAALARLARARGLDVVVHARSDARATSLREQGFEVLQRPELDATIAEHVDERTHVVIAFPPDGATDARIAPSLARAAAITYVSSTGVYGDHRGVVNDATPLPTAADVAPSGRGSRIVAAEDAYRREGGTVLRCPALYGPDRGLHVRVLRGEHRIPGDGTRYLSRIHVDDLAQLILALVPPVTALAAAATFVVGDREPARHIDVVRFVCETYGVALPPFVALETVHESLRADRRVDASRALAASRISLRYPSYREGLAPAATGLPPITKR